MPILSETSPPSSSNVNRAINHLLSAGRHDLAGPALFQRKKRYFSRTALIISHQRPQMFAIETLAVSNIAMAVDLPKRRIDYFFSPEHIIIINVYIKET